MASTMIYTPTTTISSSNHTKLTKFSNFSKHIKPCSTTIFGKTLRISPSKLRQSKSYSCVTVKCSAVVPEALLFDCDGVLVDTEKDGHRVSFNDTFTQVCVVSGSSFGITRSHANITFMGSTVSMSEFC